MSTYKFNMLTRLLILSPLALVLAACGGGGGSGDGDTTVADTPQVSPVADTPQVSPFNALLFADPLLGDCVKSEATKNGWTSLSDAKSLDCGQAGVRLLGGLDSLANLENLNLSGNPVVDLSPLGQLIGLQTVNLSSMPNINNVDALLLLDGLTTVKLDSSGDGNFTCASLATLSNRVVSVTPPDTCKVRISDVVFNDPALQRCVAATAGVTYTRDLTRLDCPNAGLVQLTGLEQFKNLRSIDLSGNQVFDLTPLGQLVRLEFIDASENPITDLSVFGQLPVLQILNLRRIPGLQNVDLLSNLVPLLELYLDGTGSGLLDCRTLDALNARLDSFTPPRNCNMPIADVVFEDPQLQNCLLTNSSGFTFTREVINLGCQSMGITSLGGIERFTNLVVLNLSNFNTSLTPIPGTPNQVQDLTPLASTFTLQALILDGNDVRDLFALRELRDLRALLVRFNPNLAAVRGLLFMDDLFRVELEGSGVTQQISCADLTTLSARLTEFSSPVNCDGVVRPSTTIGNTDLNDDGSADLVLEYNADSGVALGASSASKFWGFGVATPPSGRFDTSGLALQGFDTSVFARARAIAVADANADGRDDLLVQLDAIDGSVRWWVQLSDGVGGLGVRMDAFSLPGGNDARAVAFKDIDGDDRADILIQQQINGLVSYHVSMGTGVSFTAPEPLYTFDPGLGRPDIVALEDVNNDGTADLVFDRRLGDQHCYFVRLYNNFNGAFQQQSTSRDCHVLVSTPLGSVTGVGVADLDGDRRSELVIQQDVNELHTKWLYLTTFESSRSGTEWGSLRILAEEFTAPGTKRSFRTISVADLNGDGRSDLLVEVTTGTIKAFWAYIASAYGGFEKSVWLDGQNVSNRTLGLRDFNNDGLPDLLIDATPNLSTSQQIYVKLNERGISFGSNILGATDLWYEDSGFPRIAGLEEDGLTSVAHELGSLLAWAGTSDAKLHTPNELSQMLSAKGPGLTLRKPKYEDIGDLPLNDNECQVLYTKGSTERRTRGQFGVMACNVILAKGASLKLQPIYGGCETVNVDSVDSGFGGNCEIGSLKNELKLKVGPVVQTTTVKGPTAGSCGAISKEFICAGSSVALVRGSQTYEFGKDNGIGAGACLGCFGAGASLKEENGVISGSFELDFIAGVEFEYSVNTATVAEGAEFLVKTGNKGFVYVGENVEQGVLAAGDTFISAAQNAAGTAVDISRITQTAAGDAVFIAREGAEAVGLVLRSDSIAGQTIDAVITGVNESIDAVGGAAAYAVELAKTGGEAIWDGLNSVISSIGDLF